jgi:hypothetical protein
MKNKFQQPVQRHFHRQPLSRLRSLLNKRALCLGTAKNAPRSSIAVAVWFGILKRQTENILLGIAAWRHFFQFFFHHKNSQI